MRRFPRNKGRAHGLGRPGRSMAGAAMEHEAPVVVMHGGGGLRRQRRHAVSLRPVAACRPGRKPIPPRRGCTPAPSGGLPPSLLTWYLGLIPYWMGGRPRLKTRLLLRTHQWIVDRILAPEVDFAAAAADLTPDGALTRVLTDFLPTEDGARWQRFVRMLVAELQQALLLPVTRRNEAWVRWLFLVPYRAGAEKTG